MKRTKTERGIRHESVIDVVIHLGELAQGIEFTQVRVCCTAHHNGYTENEGVIYPTKFWKCYIL